MTQQAKEKKLCIHFYSRGDFSQSKLTIFLHLSHPLHKKDLKKIMSFVNTVFYQIQCALLYIENNAEILSAHYTWKVAEKGFKMASMMNKLAIIKPCEIILGKLKKKFQKSL